ncbi:hypothetical protein CDD82_7811 [Ophiocordyceps australis]|uniref:Uncharacterized protein n=1 Tax=Ophiocordyceps australis TaxID=1399860 RepID=A0A2C5XEC6_9HYPO|nr:hypothetical protein CDD82_7811 [Ophiocordyceps australis]
MAPAPAIASLSAALAYSTRPGAIDLKRVHAARLVAIARAEFWPIINAGMRFWPLVSLLNFTLVKTVHARNLVGALAGVAWGVYMSLMAAR